MAARWRPGVVAVAAALTAAIVLIGSAGRLSAADAASSTWTLIGVGDSLTHGTMDAVNNALNTGSAYLQRIHDSLAQRIPVAFSQPLLDEAGDRVAPFRVPTNVAVDGEDSFGIEGFSYYKRAGTDQSALSADLLAEAALPRQFEDMHDRVLFPINALTGRPTSQMGSVEWLLTERIPQQGRSRALIVYWVGNNDSSTSALGFGGANPMFLPLPVEQLTPVLPLLSTLLEIGEAQGLLSFEPYSAAGIDRNLTAIEDFASQQLHLLTRMKSAARGLEHEIFVLTLPYYSSVGYLMDSEDLEYYFGKVSPLYRVPPSFKRVAPHGQPITAPLQGDRISLLTFGLMYALLDSGFSVEFVNGVLETNGQQRDGMVLSEAEQADIRARIDDFNAALNAAASAAGPNVHVVDIGSYLNAVLVGDAPLVIGGKKISRKWMRGSSFTFDGVHPGYVGQALISNVVIAHINAVLGIDAPMASLEAVIETDPYVDRDEDGFAAGPPYAASGMTDVLFLFKDPDDGDAGVQADLPDDVWQRIVRALLQDLLGRTPALRPEAERLGLVASNN